MHETVKVEGEGENERRGRGVELKFEVAVRKFDGVYSYYLDRSARRPSYSNRLLHIKGMLVAHIKGMSVAHIKGCFIFYRGQMKCSALVPKLEYISQNVNFGNSLASLPKSWSSAFENTSILSLFCLYCYYYYYSFLFLVICLLIL